jgi:hypothetical protein
LYEAVPAFGNAGAHARLGANETRFHHTGIAAALAVIAVAPLAEFDDAVAAIGRIDEGVVETGTPQLGTARIRGAREASLGVRSAWVTDFARLHGAVAALDGGGARRRFAIVARMIELDSAERRAAVTAHPSAVVALLR